MLSVIVRPEPQLYRVTKTSAGHIYHSIISLVLSLFLLGYLKIYYLVRIASNESVTEDDMIAS